jgi:hypothetical protein
MKTISPIIFLLSLICAMLCGILGFLILYPQDVYAQGSDGGRRYVAVTGEYSEGVTLLYVLDQETQHLVVYEAKGGANNSHSVKFVGARNIELDTLLDGFNDESEYSHKDLERQFIKSGHLTEEGGIKGGAKQGN